jgi:DNA-nicking Smr family endonuclease
VIDKYNGMPPSEDHLKAFLLLDLGLKDDAVPEFIREFAATMAFAKVAESAIIQDMAEAQPTPDQPSDSDRAPHEAQSTSRRYERRPEGEPPLAFLTTPADKEWDVRLIGDRLQIKASVDIKGLRKLLRILKANEVLLSEVDESDVSGDDGNPD